MKEHISILNECLGDTLITATFPVVIPEDVDFDAAYNQIAKMVNKTGEVSTVPVDLIYWVCNCQCISNLSKFDRIQDVVIESMPEDRVVMIEVTFWVENMYPKITYTGKHDIFSVDDKEVKNCKLNLSNIRLVDPYEQSVFDESIPN